MGRSTRSVARRTLAQWGMIVLVLYNRQTAYLDLHDLCAPNIYPARTFRIYVLFVQMNLVGLLNNEYQTS